MRGRHRSCSYAMQRMYIDTGDDHSGKSMQEIVEIMRFPPLPSLSMTVVVDRLAYGPICLGAFLFFSTSGIKSFNYCGIAAAFHGRSAGIDQTNVQRTTTRRYAARRNPKMHQDLPCPTNRPMRTIKEM